MAVEAGSVIVRFVGDTARFNSAVKSFNKELGRMAKRAAIAGIAIAGVATKMAADFDKGMREISTLIDVPQEKINEMGRELRNLSIESGQALDTLVKGRYDIISAGFTDAADSAIMLNNAMKLAVGGATDVSKTADLLTTILNAYSLSAKQATNVSDIMFATVRLGKTTIDELAQSVGKLAPVARGAGLSIEGMGAVLATLTASGMATREATTYARQALIQLSAPTTQSINAMDKLKISVKRLEDGSIDLYNTFKQFQGMPLDVIRKVIPDVAAATAVLSLANNVEKLGEFTEQMGDVAGESETAYQKLLKSYSTQLSQVKNIIQDTLISLGEKILPAIMPIVKEIGGLLKEYSTEIANFFANIGKAVSFVLGDLNRFIIILGSVGVALNVAKFAMIAFNLATSANPIMLIVKAVISLGVLLYGLIKRLGGLKAVLAEVSDFGSRAFEFLGHNITETWRIASDSVKLAMLTAWEWIKFLAKSTPLALLSVGQAFISIFEFIGNAGGQVFAELGKRLANVFRDEESKKEVRNFADIIADEFDRSMNDVDTTMAMIEKNAKDTADAVAKLWANLYKTDYQKFKTKPPTIGTGGETQEPTATEPENPELTYDFIFEGADDLRKALKGNEDILETGKKIDAVYAQIGQTISSVVSSMESHFGEFFDEVMDKSVSLEESLSKLWQNILKSFIDMIVAMIARLITFTIIYTALNAITGGTLGAILKGGEAVASGPFFQGLGSFLGGGGTAENIGAAFQQAFGSIGDGVITPQGKVVRTSPSDYLFAIADPGQFARTMAIARSDTYNEERVNYNIKIEALDSDSFRTYLRKNPKALANGIANAVGRGYR